MTALIELVENTLEYENLVTQLQEGIDPNVINVRNLIDDMVNHGVTADDLRAFTAKYFDERFPHA